MIKTKILEAYEAMAEKYNEYIDIKPHNAYYDRPNTLQLLPEEVNGKIILDAACGPGKYAEILINRGAKIIGFDFSPKMIALAKNRNTKGTFFVHDLSDKLTMINDKLCDIVLCTLALHYIENWNSTIIEFHRVLKKDGILVISIEHPFFDFMLYNSTKYFEIENAKYIWKGFGQPTEVNSFRRPLNECITPLTDNGFYIDKLVEPKPTKEFELADPKHFKELNEFPSFMCIRAVKK